MWPKVLNRPMLLWRRAQPFAFLVKLTKQTATVPRPMKLFAAAWKSSKKLRCPPELAQTLLA